MLMKLNGIEWFDIAKLIFIASCVVQTMCILYRYSSSTILLTQESLQRILMSSYTSLQYHIDIARSGIYFFEFSCKSMRVTRLNLFMLDIFHVN